MNNQDTRYNNQVWKFTIVVCLYLVSWLLVIPALADTGTSIDISRSIYSGRTMGMGEANVASANDGEGLFINPSQLATLQFPQMMGLSRKLVLDETDYTLYSYAVPTDWGTFGIGYAGAATGNSLPTTRDPGTNRVIVNPSLEATGYDTSVTIFTYARTLPWNKISVGSNLKLFNQSLNGNGSFDRASGYGIDLSASYKPIYYLNLGATFQNIIASSINWQNSSDTFGGYFKLGAAMNVLGQNTAEAYRKFDQNIIACFDLDIPRDVLGGVTLMHLGAEWAVNNVIALRAGIDQENGGTGLTFGVGIKNSAIRFDYAYAQRPGITGDTPHYFSISYVGDRIVNVVKKYKRRDSGVRVLYPPDRLLTSLEVIDVTAEARFRDVYQQSTTWTVPLISTTSEVKEIYDLKDLVDVRRNGFMTGQTGTIEIKTPLLIGRNVITISGFASGEINTLSGEVKVLRMFPYKDLDMSYWSIEPIALCSAIGLIQGYPDNTFRPTKGITRAELTTLLVRCGSIDAARWEKVATMESFKDVKKTWYTPYINLGVEQGLVTGYPDNTFQPKKVLTRAEAITIIARFAQLPTAEGSAFPDLDNVYWANKYITPARNGRLLLYLEGKNFEPNREFTRDEAAEVLFRTADIQRKIGEFWAYGGIIKARGTDK